VIPTGGTTVKTGPWAPFALAPFVMIAIMLRIRLRDAYRERTDRCQQ
jgi:hypothetical protein